MDRESRLFNYEREILHSFPTLTQQELDEANDIFPHYIFYRREQQGRVRRIWTSCCHRNGVAEPLLQRNMTPELQEVLYGREGSDVTCPWCGRRATLKGRGRMRGRGAVLRRNAVFLHAVEGNLYAQSYWLEKTFDTAPAKYPTYCGDVMYYFAPGLAISFTNGYGGWWAETERGRMTSKKQIKKPFFRGGMGGHELYRVIGLEALSHSFARYCGYAAWREGEIRLTQDGEHDALLRFLTAAAIYPRQLEMLVKAKQRRLVADMLWAGKKNAKVFTWEKEDARKAFHMSRTELRDYLAQGDNVDLLYLRRRLGQPIQACAVWLDNVWGLRGLNQFDEFCKECDFRHLGYDELRKYLLRFTGVRCHGGIFGLNGAYTLWKDYVANAEAAGFDVAQRSVLLPRALEEAHDNAAAIVQRRREAQDSEKKQQQNKLARNREETLNATYGFETEHFLIRAPHNAAEIIAEGRVLQHCVGGYAQRHAEGASTILLLREKKRPGEPLCTIEVNKFRLVQIHGFRNECEKGAVKPEIRFAEIYQPWKAWLDGGCKRGKDGKPILPKNNKAAVAADRRSA